MATEKEINDHDLVGGKFDDPEHLEAVRQEALHHGHLSAEELEIEKKLRRKIDARIMPVLITIYLMNYIDRYVSVLSLGRRTLIQCQKQLRRSTFAGSRGRPWSQWGPVSDRSLNLVCWVSTAWRSPRLC